MIGRRQRTTLVGRAAVVVALTLLVGGCDGVKEELGLTKKAPDEFTVVQKAPLVMPPDFQLRPPRPGAARPNEVDPANRARDLLTGNERQASAGGGLGGVRPSPESRGPGSNMLPAASIDGRRSDGPPQSASEQAFLGQAGTAKATPDIRRLIDRETANLEASGRSFTDKLIFWQAGQPTGTVVDPAKEAQRLQQNAATGKPVTAGETPVIVRRQRGILEGIF